MRKILLLTICALMVFAMAVAVFAAKGGKKAGCITLKDGILVYNVALYPSHYLTDTPISVGTDIYGSNYQAHMFNGSYANNYLGRDGFPPYEGDDVTYLVDNPGAASHWAWPYRNVDISMKWNDAWLSNMDCDGDDVLDRSDPYIGSGAWLTNHIKGTYDDGEGNTCKWNYFVKIVAAPADAHVDAPYDDDGNGTWYADEDDTKIGPQIWGNFAIIQEIGADGSDVDPCGIHGKQYVSPNGPGFGIYKP